MSILWKPFSKSLRVLNRLNHSNKKEKDDTINQDMIRSLASNHEQVQQRIFTKWINMHLDPSGIRINSVEKDLRDGHVLHALLKQLTHEHIKDIDKKNTRFHQLSNVSICLEFLEGKLGELPNIGTVDIVDGNLKLTLGLLWLIILRFQIQQVLSFEEDTLLPNSPLSLNSSSGYQSLQSSDSISQTNRGSSTTTANLISKSVGKGGDPKKFLLEWVQGQLRSYDGLIPQVRDFSCSWQSGLAFAALIHHYDPSLVPNLGEMVERGSRDKDEWRDVLDTSFRIAKEGMGIPSLLEPDDILSASIPDEKIIMMYVSEFYKVMSAKQAQEDDSQEQMEALISQFMQLSGSICSQIEKFSSGFDNTPFDLSSASPMQLEELTQIHRQRSKSLNEYEPTVQTMERSAANILTTQTNLDPELAASVVRSRDMILIRWKELHGMLDESERGLNEIQSWGELNYRITQLDERLKNLSSLCSDFMELKHTWSESEKLDRLTALRSAVNQGADQLKELKEIAGDQAPAHIQRRLRRCGELIDIAHLNIERFQISFEVNELTNSLSDSLLKLFQKRGELRKLVKLSAWTPEMVSRIEIQRQRDDQVLWKQIKGEKIMAEVKARCAAIRLTIDSSTFERAGQMQPVLLKEDEINVSWQEIERLLSVQELLMQQSAEVDSLVVEIGSLTLSVDQLQEDFDTQDFGEDFEERIDQCLQVIETLHEKRHQLPFPQLPETISSDDFIANHISHALDVQTQRLMALRRERKAYEEDNLTFELYSSIQRDGDELAASATQHAAWIEDNLELLAKASHADALMLFAQISDKQEELETQNAQLDEHWRTFSQRIEDMLPQLKLKSQGDHLRSLQSQLDAQRELIESLTFKMVEILNVGPHVHSRITFFIELQAETRVLLDEVSCAQVGQTTPESLQAWSKRLETLGETRATPHPACNTAAFIHLTQLNHELTTAIQATDDALDLAGQELSTLEIHVQDHPFQEFTEQVDDFISASKSLGDMTKKTLSTYQIKSTDDSQVLAAKLSALSMFVASLQEKAGALQAERASLDSRLKDLHGQPANPNMSTSASKSHEADALWEENAATIAVAPIIHQQVQELTTRFSQLHQVDATIQQTRSDVIDLLNAAGDDLDSQVKVLEEMLSKITLLLNRVAKYESPELPPATPADISQILDANHHELKELIRQIEASLNATRLLFTTNREKAQKHQAQTQADNCAHWEAWCRQQGELLEDEQRLLRSTLWKDVNTAGLDLLSKAQAARLQLQDKVAQNQVQFEASRPSESNARAAFAELDSAIKLQLGAIPKARALSAHWTLVLQVQRWINHHKALLSKTPLDAGDLEAVQLAINDSDSELSQAYSSYLASVPAFTELCGSLSENKDSIFMFVDPVRLEELIQASHSVPAEWDQLHRLTNETRDLIQASDMCRIIHERIELLQGKVQSIKATSQSKKINEASRQQLDEIEYEVKDQILTLVRKWQNLVFSLPRDNAGWSGKVKLTGEMIDLLTCAIEEKRRLLTAQQDQSKLLALCDKIDMSIGNYLSVIDAIAKDADKSSTFLADLEKAALRLAEAEAAATPFIDKGLDELIEGLLCLGDWQIEERAQVLPAQWEEVRRMGLDLQAKLAKRIDYKQGAAHAQTIKKMQRAKSRAPLKYVPPNKDTIKSRYMGGAPEKKEPDAPPPKPKPSPNAYVADMKDTLDVEVARIVNSYPQMVKVTRDNESGKYWIGDRDPKLCFCRVLRSNLVMVRIGGGWTELSKYLADHAVENLEYRSASRSQSRSQPRAGSSLDTIFEHTKSPTPSSRDRIIVSPSRSGRVLSPLSGIHDSPRFGSSLSSFADLRPITPNSIDSAFTKHTMSSMGKFKPIPRCSSPASASPINDISSITTPPSSKIQASPQALRPARSSSSFKSNKSNSSSPNSSSSHTPRAKAGLSSSNGPLP